MSVFSFKFETNHIERPQYPDFWKIEASGEGEGSIDEVIARIADFKEKYVRELEEADRRYSENAACEKTKQLIGKYGHEMV